MHKLFIGNLSETVSLQELNDLLKEHQLRYIAVQLRDGLGLVFHGSRLKVEPTTTTTGKVVGGASSSSCKIANKRLPTDVDRDDLEQFVRAKRQSERFEKAGTRDRPRNATKLISQDAEAAVSRLDKPEYQGTIVKTDVFMERTGGSTRTGQQHRRTNPGGVGRSAPMGAGGDAFHGGHGAQAMGGQGRPPLAGQDMPLRMVVDAKFVGAIIGQGGANIREITKESKARCVVDVQRAVRDQSGNMEKVISIFGQPENCSKACIKVLEVVIREAEKENNGQTVEPELKLRAHNQLVGRLIGKGGATIKKIMEETSTTVFVSNEPSPGRAGGGDLPPPALFHHLAAVPPFYPSIGELNAFNMERTITIRGTLDAIAQAEERISAKLRQSYENDLANGANGVFPGAVPPHLVAPTMLPGADPFAGALGQTFPPHHALHAIGGVRGNHAQQPMTEVVHMWVPNNMVGALIGTKGVHIRNVMRITGAHIRIEGGAQGTQQAGAGAAATTTPASAPATTGAQSPAVNGGPKHEPGADDRHNDERLVTITGTDQQQYKAQFWIYQRVAEQGYHFFDEVRLCTEVSVPSKLVGRIIGKGGQNVRELQRVTGAQVKIPEDAAEGDTEETIVRVVGNFQASQAVQNRLRQLVQQYQSQQQQGGGGRSD
uniref:K Homology domain-containing protein n=1 Tax=Plectus sambesii TaxID=2011161 RepID=A0A914UWI3_9BILA